MALALEKMKIVSGNKTNCLMKKIIYTLLSICAVGAIAISCEKEMTEAPGNTSKVAVDSNIPMTIEALINPDDAETRTQYAGNTTFGWTSGDQVRMPVVKWSGANSTGSITACDLYTFTTNDASGSTAATFIRNGNSDNMDSYDPNPSGAAASWTSMGYLVYPVGIFGKEYSGTKPVVTLPSSITYNESTPLDGGIIPLIGRKDGETYKFSTAVGILKVTLANAPSDATVIKLISSDKPVAGKFAISDVSATVSQIANTSATAGTQELSLSVSSLTAGSTYDFYFPLPVGTYDKGTLKLQIIGANSLVMLEQNVGKALSIERNCILSVPTLTYHRVYVNGSLSNPYLYTVKPSTANTIRVCVSTERLTSDNYSKSNWKEGNRFGSSTSYRILDLGGPGGGNVITATGDYYLQYIVCSTATQPDALSDANVMVYGSVPFKYIASTTKIPVEETWLDVPYVSTAEGAVAYLVDGDTSTYWHSPYGSEDPARNATYGQIISVDLNKGSLTTDGNFYFSFRTRGGATNDHAKAMNVYVSNVPWSDEGFDAGKVLVGSTENALEGIVPSTGMWIKKPIVCSGSGSYRYITVSILSTYGTTRTYNLLTEGCTHMAEIEFYTK